MSVAETLPRIDFPMKVYRGTVIFAICEIEAIEHMEVRPDDVFVATFPRSGTTLTQELVYLILTKDFETANRVTLDERCPVLDYKNDQFPFYRGVSYVEGLPRTSPRIMKTHLHYSLLPKQVQAGNGKIVHLMRNPKDAIVSQYKLFKYLKILDPDDNTSFNDFFESFLAGKDPVLCSPWARHVTEYWAHRNDSNMLLLRFEDVRKDKVTAIKSIASFLNQRLTEDEVQHIVEHSSLDNMKKNPMTNMKYWDDIQPTDHSFGGMINQGGIGSSKGWFTPDMDRRMNEMVQRELAGTGLVFPDML